MNRPYDDQTYQQQGNILTDCQRAHRCVFLERPTDPSISTRPVAEVLRNRRELLRTTRRLIYDPIYGAYSGFPGRLSGVLGYQDFPKAYLTVTNPRLFLDRPIHIYTTVAEDLRIRPVH